MHHKWINSALYAALISLAAPVMGSGESEEPHSQYRVLEWNELVPEGWEPPLVPEPYDEVGTSSIRKDSVAQELNQQLAALAGFMKPVVFEDNQVGRVISSQAQTHLSIGGNINLITFVSQSPAEKF